MVRFDYFKLAELAGETRKAAEEANAYANDLDKKIKNPLNNYTGKHTGNINTAYEKVRLKSNQLRQKAGTLTSYSSRIDTFAGNVINAENRLTNRISSLMGNFKKKWNIKDPSFLERVVEGICDFFGLGDIFDSIRDFFKSLKAHIKHFFDKISDWYHFKGGAELIDAIVAIVTAIVLVVIDIVLIFFTGGAWLAVKIAIATLVAIIAFCNAVGKICQYMKTFGKSHVLHQSANNKIASDTDMASWLRRNGEYTAATIFEIAEFVVTVADMILNVAEFAKNWINIIKTESGRFFQNFAKSMKMDWSKYNVFKVFKKGEDAKNKWKMAKTIVNIVNGTYSMLRTNNYGKNGWQAFTDTFKAGKDTWDTLFAIGLENVWTFQYFTGEVDPVTQVEKTDFQKMNKFIGSKVLKNSISAYNKISSTIKHNNLNLNNFSYDAKIGKTIETWGKIGKMLSNSGSPTKQIAQLAEWASENNSSMATSSQIRVGSRLWPVSYQPILGGLIFSGGGSR